MTAQGRRPAQTAFSERVASWCMLIFFGLLCSAGSVAVWVEYSANEPQFVLDNPKPCPVRHSH